MASPRQPHVRWPILLALLLAPTALAETYEHAYVVTGGGFGGGGALIQNGETYFPVTGGEVIARADDLRSPSVFVRVCHEWTFDDGSHARVQCVADCTQTRDALRWPPYAHNTTYRVIVDLRLGPGPCDARPLAGTLRVSFS